MMECTTGLTDDEFDGLLAWLREEGVEGYPPILGLSGSLTATLMYLRQNISASPTVFIGIAFSSTSLLPKKFDSAPVAITKISYESSPLLSISLFSAGITSCKEAILKRAFLYLRNKRRKG